MEQIEGYISFSLCAVPITRYLNGPFCIALIYTAKRSSDIKFQLFMISPHNILSIYVLSKVKYMFSYFLLNSFSLTTD